MLAKSEVITSCMNEERFQAVEARNVKYLVDAPVTNHQLNELFVASWGAHQWTDFEAVVRHSLVYVCACLGDELIGFVNLAWDGGRHAFILDTTVHPDQRGRGIGRRLVRQALEVAEDRRIEWVHVDFEPHLRGFYLACGFRATEAGLLHLTEPHEDP
jgi:GNAT superfamily N-acetyltransferase